jgi:hypothetical protein
LGPSRRRYDLELCSDYVCVKIPIVDGINILVGNNYFSPGTKPKINTGYFKLLESIPDTSNFRFILLGDCNVPRFNWESWSLLPKCHYFFKLKVDDIYTFTSLVHLRKCVEAVDSHDLLDLVSVELID